VKVERRPRGCPRSLQTAPSPWPARAQATAKAIQEWVTRPRVTLCIVGVVLAFGGLLLTNSVWTLPLVPSSAP
jgi:hypothetical protein